MKIYICTNNNQLIGAQVAKYSILKRSDFQEKDIVILNENDVPEVQSFYTKPYLRSGKMMSIDKDDMQSFTLLRFHIPKIMDYKGYALVIDPDIFQVKEGLDEAQSLIKKSNAQVLARKGIKKNSWSSSAMILSCNQLSKWSIEDMIIQMQQGKLDYDNLINLRDNNLKIEELGSHWNEFDEIKSKTILLHTTEKITQPWRAKLKLNSSIPPILKILPRAPIYKLFGKDLTVGREHPSSFVSNFFFSELTECIKKDFISMDLIKDLVEKKYVRSDIFSIIEKRTNS